MGISFFGVKSFLGETVVKQMVRMLPNLSMKNIIKIIEI